MNLLTDLANAIARFEGFFAGNTLAKRNNNPGNLRQAPTAIGTDAKGYAVFATEADGWAALQRQIQLDMDRGLTLRQWLYKYAPPSDGNNTDAYIAYVAGRLGIPDNVPLQDLAAGPRPGQAA